MKWRLFPVICLVGACGRPVEVTLPAPASSPAPILERGLYAGFGRSDITPPPGVGLAAYATENRQSTGWRHRLYVRALVLDDGSGQRVALAVANLPHISPILHRLAAERLQQGGSPIGADRFVLSATHTHSGPGNFYEVEQYNNLGGRFPGYDPHLVEFLVSGIVAAVRQAEAELKPAKAGWLDHTTHGFAWNRSMRAYALNPRSGPLPDDLTALDRQWSVLRVDQCGPGWNDCQMKGAFSVFAIHGTSYPSANSILDGDIHALVERGLEEEIERQNPALQGCEGGTPPNGLTRCTFRSRAVHVFANGTEGDASPVSARPGSGTRCGVHRHFVAGRRPGGPRTPPAPEEWRESEQAVADCLSLAHMKTNALGALMSQAVVDIYRNVTVRKHLELKVAFTTLDLRELTGSHPLCEGPRPGTANLGGSEDGPTRFRGWAIAWAIPLGFDESGGGIDRNPKSCHGAKQIFGGRSVQKLLVGQHGLPHLAQLTVMRVGDRLIAAVPAEVTTTAGLEMKAAIRTAYLEALEENGDPLPDSVPVLVISLANGFMQYITTAAEYEAQEYEGGSTLWGPNSSAALAEQLARLARSLPGTPIVEVEKMVVGPGSSRSYFPRPTGPPWPGAVTRRVEPATCANGMLVATWVGAPPGRLLPSAGQVVEIQRRTAAGTWEPAAWDDHRSVVVRAIGKAGGGFRWQVTWSPDQLPPGEYRVFLPQRKAAGLPDATSPEPVTC